MKPALYLIRHTRPTIAQGLCYGQSDIPLCENFPNEAREVQGRLAHCVFSKVYTSPLQRCLLLGEALNLPLQVDSRLMEMNFGEWEKKSWDAIFASTQGKRWFENYLTTPCPSGESFADLLARVTAFLQDKGVAQYKQEKEGTRPTGLNLLPYDSSHCLITHAGVIRALLILLCGLSPHEVFDIDIPYGHIVTIAGNGFSLSA